jgi:murein L,D-transpeptidase YafK
MFPLSVLLLCLFIAPSSSGESIQADKILVEKAKRVLTLYSGDEPIKKYRVALGKNPLGHKVREGDKKTPEGVYYVDYRNSDSRFYKALHISYPNKNDIRQARSLGISPGSHIMIHGLKKELEWTGPYHRVMDWTDGCIAVTNYEIQEIWDMVPDGTPVEIVP